MIVKLLHSRLNCRSLVVQSLALHIFISTNLKQSTALSNHALEPKLITIRVFRQNYRTKRSCSRAMVQILVEQVLIVKRAACLAFDLKFTDLHAVFLNRTASTLLHYLI